MNVQTPRHLLLIPPLENGDRLTRAEFERRYHAMPEVKKAELLQGEVYMPSPVRWGNHATPHADLLGILFQYRFATPGVSLGSDGTVRLDDENEPQPDAAFIILPEHGGRVRMDADGYVSGVPEFVAEVSASTVSIDRNRKLEVYRQSGVSEYLIWRVQDGAVDWFTLTDGQYVPLPPDPADGVTKSRALPGLWLDAAALARGDLPAVLAALQRGIASPEHAAFVQALAAARR